MGWDDSDWETVTYRTTKRDRFVISRLAEEDFFSSVSDAIRTAIQEMVSEEDPEGREERINQLKEFYSVASRPKIAEFFAETTYVMDRLGDFAQDHGEDWWVDEVEAYVEDYFDSGKILAYRQNPDEFNREFLDDTVGMVAELGKMAETYGDEEIFEQVDTYFAEYFAESRAEDKPYLKFKL